MIAVEYLSDLRKASSIPGLTRALDAGAAPFDRPEWWQDLAVHCGLQPCYAVAHDASGAVMMPLQRHAAALTTQANWYTFRWRPLVSPGTDPAPLLAALARSLRGEAYQVSLPQLPDEDQSATALRTAFRAAGWITRLTPSDSNHVLHVGGRDFSAYQASLPGPLRTTLKRKAARVDCEIHHAFSDDVWAHYATIYADSWKPEEGSPAFLRAFAEAEAMAGRLRLGLARIAGEPVAAQLWTVDNGTAYIHKLAHRESARAQSPGSVLSAALFEQVIDRDHVTLIDFGTGNDAYKADWMNDVRPRYHLEALDPAQPRAWPPILKQTIRVATARLAPRGARS